MHGLKSVILAILPRISQSAVSPALHFHPKKMAGNGCISFYQSNMNKNYHQKLRLVFCHSDPDPSSVL
jgi:hypothetical protein